LTIDLEQLTAAVRAMQVLQHRADLDPIAWVQWLPNQDRFLRSPSRRKLIRQGQQWGGKSWAALAEIDWRCRGVHPHFDTARPPIEAWVVCASWQQSVAVQSKYWEISQEHLDPACKFDAVNGFHANRPTARYPNGSIVRFKTTGQRGLDLASATIHVALFDEPPKSARTYGEVQARVRKTNGAVLLSLTPINAPTDWLREMVEKGVIDDFHARMEPENMIPLGSDLPLTLTDGTVMDQDWIDRILLETLPHEVPVVCHGEWECRVEGRVFRAFSDVDHVSDIVPRGQVELCLGIDYGQQVGKQVAVLIAVDQSGDYDRIWILDEAIAEGNTSSDQDARAILQMLKSNGVRWKQLDHVWGDRVYIRGPADRKSNSDTMKAVAKELGVSPNRLNPKIRTVKQGRGRAAGSVDAGCRYLHQAMVRPGHFSVHPQCENVLEAFNRWDYRDDIFKDKIDAIRYAIQWFIFSKRRTRTAQKLYLY